MIIVFDLDDTLYDEMTFVQSGFRAVGLYLHKTYGINLQEAEISLNKILLENGRGNVFDLVLKQFGFYSKRNVSNCLSVYRGHIPKISLSNDVLETLENLSDFKKYIVTDGNKLVQRSKIKALGLDRYVEKSYVTHQYGLASSKPSIHCFELIKSDNNCEWSDLCYIGDNPTKDFVNLKPLGVKTIRILTKNKLYRNVSPDYEAEIIIDTISELNSIFKKTRAYDN